MDDIIQVQIIFSLATKRGIYNDAIYITFDQYEKMTQDEIDQLKQVRVDMWIERLDNPPVAPELTKQQLIDLKMAVEQQAAELSVQATDLTQKIAAKG